MQDELPLAPAENVEERLLGVLQGEVVDLLSLLVIPLRGRREIDIRSRETDDRAGLEPEPGGRLSRTDLEHALPARQSPHLQELRETDPRDLSDERHPLASDARWSIPRLSSHRRTRGATLPRSFLQGGFEHRRIFEDPLDAEAGEIGRRLLPYPTKRGAAPFAIRDHQRQLGRPARHGQGRREERRPGDG